MHKEEENKKGEQIMSQSEQEEEELEVPRVSFSREKLPLAEHFKFVKSTKDQPCLQQISTGVIYYKDSGSKFQVIKKFRCMNRKTQKCASYLFVDPTFDYIMESRLKHTCKQESAVIRHEIKTKEQMLLLLDPDVKMFKAYFNEQRSSNPAKKSLGPGGIKSIKPLQGQRGLIGLEEYDDNPQHEEKGDEGSDIPQYQVEQKVSNVDSPSRPLQLLGQKRQAQGCPQTLQRQVLNEDAVLSERTAQESQFLDRVHDNVKIDEVKRRLEELEKENIELKDKILKEKDESKEKLADTAKFLIDYILKHAK